MKIILSRILHDDKLSSFRVRDMRPDEIIVVNCDNVSEFLSSKRNAESGARTANRLDGFSYRIQTNSISNQIKVSLYKDGVVSKPSITRQLDSDDYTEIE